MSEQTHCSECGARILTLTAAETGGLCMPCKQGTRRQIEEGRRRYREDKAFQQSPPWLFWLRLVKKASHEGGLGALSDDERLYYAVGCLRGDVIGGGFHSYFWNNDSDLVSSATRGLIVMRAEQSLLIFNQAKSTLPDTALNDYRSDALKQALDDPHVIERMDELDRRFWADPDDLWSLMVAFAARRSLYPHPDAD